MGTNTAFIFYRVITYRVEPDGYSMTGHNDDFVFTAIIERKATTTSSTIGRLCALLTQFVLFHARLVYMFRCNAATRGEHFSIEQSRLLFLINLASENHLTHIIIATIIVWVTSFTERGNEKGRREREDRGEER